MDAETALRIERANCRRKACFDERGARRAARRYELVAYPCPIRLDGQGPHWHVGHSPTTKTLARIALAIRAQRGEL